MIVVEIRIIGDFNVVGIVTVTRVRVVRVQIALLAVWVCGVLRRCVDSALQGRLRLGGTLLLRGLALEGECVGRMLGLLVACCLARRPGEAVKELGLFGV